MDPDYSIAIVNYNGGSKLLECVESVFKFTRDFELILVDNASTDKSVESIESKFPQCITFRNEDNIGFAGANNVAMRKARGQWIVLLNPDTIVTKNWLENLLDCANSTADIGILTPKLLRMDRKTINSTGHIFDFKRGFARDRGSGEQDTGQYEVAEEVASCCFACAAIRKDVIDRVGLLDEKMLMYYEDVDFCIRSRIAGWRVFYCPKSTVFHYGAGVTPVRKLRVLLRRSTAYRLRIMLKSYRRTNAIRYGVYSIITSIVAGAKNRDPDYFWSYVRSPVWNILNLPVAEREAVQQTRRVADRRIANLARSGVGE